MSFLSKVEAEGSITKDMLKQIREDINKALEPVGEKYGVKLTAGNASYTENNFTLKLEGAAVKEDGTVAAKDAEAFKRHAHLYGLSPDDLGRKFTSQGKEFTITGLNTKSGKYPIIGRDSNGKGYKFGADMVKFFLSQNK